MRLEDTRAVITGGSSGIGRQMAIDFAEEGADVAIGDIREEPKGDETVPTAELVAERGREAFFYEVDVADQAQCERLVEQAAAELGGIDVFVNNAGLFLDSARGKTVEALTLEEWSRMIDINLTSVYSCSKFAIPHLRESDQPRLINIASKMGLVGHPAIPAYGSAKAGVVLLTKAMAIDYAPEAITVNAICPGVIKTGTKLHRFEQKGDRMVENTPLPYLGEPADIARTAVFLASADAKFITGQAIAVDGGWTAQ